MITGAKLRDASTYLDGHLRNNDYYSENETVRGEWVGSGARMLGIEDAPIRAGDKIFEGFRKNRMPSGEKMTPRDRDDRIRFLDFQVGAPKSVSIMAVTMGDARLIDAHLRAVEVAFAEMEQFAACQSNTLTERANRFTGNLTAARFLHTASRELDPQLHCHLVTVAATHDAESGGWRALTEFEIFKAIRYLGKVYQNELAASCRELGYELRDSNDERGRKIGFELEGVSEEIIKRYSKRRAQVEQAIEQFEAKHGREPSNAEVHVLVRLTRDAKLAEITTPQVIAMQRNQLTEKERDTLESLRRNAMRHGGAESNFLAPGIERECLRRAVSQIYERSCAETGHSVMAEALNERLGGLRLAALKRAMSGPELVPVRRGDGDVRKDIFVTPAELRRERWLLTVACEDRGALRPLAENVSVCERLSEDQSGAVKDLLSCRDRIACLRGAAGAGKTTVLTEVDRILREDGRAVAYCAPTASAADILRKDGLAGADTLASFLTQAEKTEMPSGSVLVVDEAGLASHRDGQAVLRLATRHDWRVIFVGDTKQHSSVEAGDFLRLLETRSDIHQVELTEIRRQTDAGYRAAVKLMSAGEAREGMRRLDEMGRLKEGGVDYLQNAAREYLDAVSSPPTEKSVLCVAPTWAENHALTRAIRVGLKQRGMLKNGDTLDISESLAWTGREKSDASRFRPGLTLVFDRRSDGFRKGETVSVMETNGNAVIVARADGSRKSLNPEKGGFDVCAPREIEVSPGDQLLMRANDRSRGIINGSTLRVESVKSGVIHTVEGIKIAPSEFSRFGHGYVVTSYRSQGKTCDKVIVAAAKLDAKTAYVACSRGRSECTIHTPDRALLMRAIPSGDRPLATEQPRVSSLAKPAPEKQPEVPQSMAWFAGPWSRMTAWFDSVRHSKPVISVNNRDDIHATHAPSL